jgi:hypothetical protein
MFCQTAKMNSRTDKSEKTDFRAATLSAAIPAVKLSSLTPHIFL